MNKDIEEKEVEFSFEDSSEYDTEGRGIKRLLRNEFELRHCDELKEVCIEDTIHNTVKIVNVTAKIDKLCPNRKIAVAIQLIDTCNNEIIAQIGKIFDTGCISRNNNTIYGKFQFALPGYLCKDEKTLKVEIIANYILDCKLENVETCNCI